MNDSSAYFETWSELSNFIFSCESAPQLWSFITVTITVERKQFSSYGLRVVAKEDDPLLYFWEEMWREGISDGFLGWANVRLIPLSLNELSISFKYEEQVSLISRLTASSNRLEAEELIQKNKEK